MRPVLIIVYLGLAFFTSCKKLGLCKDENLLLARVNYSGDNLKLDGYYYSRRSESESVGLLLFYNNGIVLSPGNPSFSELDQSMQEYAKQVFKERKYGWGVFHVIDSTILIERWGPAQCGLAANLSKGKILNDSTFVLTKSVTRKGSYKEEFNISATYIFQQFAPKPDSANNFIQ